MITNFKNKKILHDLNEYMIYCFNIRLNFLFYYKQIHIVQYMILNHYKNYIYYFLLIYI